MTNVAEGTREGKKKNYATRSVFDEDPKLDRRKKAVCTQRVEKCTDDSGCHPETEL